MIRLPMFCGLGILFLALLVSSGASQDTKKDKDDAKKDKMIKGAVPAGWKALKLTKEQSKKVQTIDAEYKTKIAELTAKIDELKQQAKIEMAKQLTDDQKAILARLAGLDTKDKDAPKDKSDAKKDGDKDKK